MLLTIIAVNLIIKVDLKAKDNHNQTRLHIGLPVIEYTSYF